MCITHSPLINHIPFITRREVFITYRRDIHPSGSFYWCDSQRPIVSSDMSLPLHEVTDIYIGKQTPIMSSAITRDVPDNRCISIIGRRGISLNLEAYTRDDLAALLASIKELLTNNAKKVMANDNEAKATGAAARRYSVSRPGGGVVLGRS
jgi:hypothetical protein